MLKCGNFSIALAGRGHIWTADEHRVKGRNLPVDGPDRRICRPYGPTRAEQKVISVRCALYTAYLLFHADILLLLLDHSDVSNVFCWAYQ